MAMAAGAAGLFVVVVFPARVPVTTYAVIGVQQSSRSCTLAEATLSR